MFNFTFLRTRISLILVLLSRQTVRKLWNIAVAVLSFLLKRVRSSASPSLLIINLTFRCNYKCIMCQKSNPAGTPYETWYSLVEYA